MKKIKILVVIFLVGLSVLACGKRGKPVFEGGQYPRSYPVE